MIIVNGLKMLTANFLVNKAQRQRGPQLKKQHLNEELEQHPLHHSMHQLKVLRRPQRLDVVRPELPQLRQLLQLK